MNLYGNVIWNNATPNSEKAILVFEQEKLQEVTKALDESGMNYCYYVIDNQVSVALAKVAVNNADLPVLESVPALKDLKIEQPKKDYISQSSIIGNTAYRDIKNRNYQSLNTDLALKVADELTKKGIAFSGKIYGDNTTITIDKKDRADFEKTVQNIVRQRSDFKQKINAVNETKQELSRYFSPEQINALQPSIDLLYTNNEFFKDHFLYHFGKNVQRYSPEQLARYSKVFNEMFDQIDQMKFFTADMSKLSNLQKQIENEILFDELVYLKGFNAEQKDCIKRLIDMDVSRAILDVIDYDFTPKNIMQIVDIVQKPDYYNEFVKFVADIKDIELGTMYNLLNRNAYLANTAEFTYLNYDIDNYTVSQNGVYTIPIETNIGLLNRLADSGLVLQGEQTKVFIQTDGNDFHKIVIPDFSQNTVSVIDTSDLFTDTEQKIFANRITEIKNLEQQRQMLTPKSNVEEVGETQQINTTNLETVVAEIGEKEKAFTELVKAGEFSKAKEILNTLDTLVIQAESLKAEIQKEEITKEDIDKLRNIEPKRKSVQNMLETEVAQTPKFEQLLGEELGEKSPYEMRRGNNNWLSDETKKVPIIMIEKRDLPEKITDVRKGKFLKEINRGDFVNKDIGITITFSRKSIDETVANAIRDNQRKEPIEARIAALFQMGELLEKSICFDSVISEYDIATAKNKSPNTLFMHKLYSVFSYNGEIFLANIAVEEMYREKLDQSIETGINRVYNFKNIKITPMELGGQTHGLMPNGISNVPIDVTEISIPDLYQLVKTYDQSFYENENAIGRSEREIEIAAQQAFADSIKTFEEYQISNQENVNNNLEHSSIKQDVSFSVGNNEDVEFSDVIGQNIGLKEDTLEEQHPIYQRENSFDKSIRLLNEFCENEYETKANFSNLDHIDIAYTTDEETDIEIQVYADLEKYRIVTEYGGKEVREELFSDIDDMAAALDNLDFSELVSLNDEEKSMLIPESTVEQVEEIGQYTIYQLTDGKENHYKRFEGLDRQPEPVNISDYQAVYQGSLFDIDGENKLESIFTKFNMDIPTDFTGHSLSVSDVIVTEIDGEKKAYFCDRIGFAEIPDFFKEIEREQTVSSEQDNSELIKEKNKAIIDNLVVGSKIILPENSWEITKINGDFSAEFKNFDDNSIMSGHSYIGHWKENLLDEAGDNLIVVIDENEKAEQQTERSETKNEVENDEQKFHQQTEKQSDQLKLDFNQPVPEESPQAAVDEVPKAENFIIKDENLGTGTQLERFNNNLAAISTLIELEQNNQQATPEQQEILSKYVGWGGLSEFFKETNPHYQELKSLLTEDEYSSARSTTLDSFYTSPVIIDSIYKVLQNSGFESGNILEPSMGVGNFFGRMPEEMQKNSKLFGVEIDGLTGRIAKQLYPNAHIQIKGFEKTNFKDSSFDVVVGNVPFGDFSLQYDSQSLKIHDYFFMQALDKVKDGGIVAFVTSKGTLDKKDSHFREMLAEKADLLGAIRLPNTAFKTAGTEVTADIIFLQKRPTPLEKMPEWVNIGVNENAFPINQYFIDNPDMVLGQIVQGNKMYGRNDGTMCIPFENTDLSQQLDQAVNKIQAVFAAENKTIEPIEQTVEIPENLRNYSYFESKGNIYTVDNNSVVCLSDKDHWGRSYTKANIERAKDYIQIRDTVRELLSVQQEFSAAADERIAQLQVRLNTQYDKFYEKYGLLHNSFNTRLFRDDSSFPLMLSLEDKVDKNILIKKSDIFFQRTIKEPQVVDSVDTAQEALVVSIAETGKIDLEYMSALSDIPVQGIINELKGEIFPVPELSTGDNIVYQTSSEYLSGDIYKKLEQAQMAAETNDIFKDNVAALEKVIPTPLQAADIDIELGATWIPPEYYQQFMYELFKTPSEYRADVEQSYWQRRSKRNIEITYSEHSNKWHISNKSVDTSTAARDFGTKARNAYAILENILNLHIPNVTRTVTDLDGKKTTIMDLDATKLVKRKAARIQKAFKDWIYRDPTRRKELVDLYNRKFNCVRPREYSAEGAALTLAGMSSSFELREHQKTAVAHAVYGGNTLLAHCVGAGKTFEMIAIAMESKRLGLCNKSLFAVPNHLTEQVGADFMKLYPNANVLVATKKDFTKQNRKKLLAKIATGNYDAVIIGHSQLSMIPISPEREIELLKTQIDNITKGIVEMKMKDGNSMSIKEMERTRKSLKQKLEKLLQKPKDDMVHFEELGIDKLFVDEAHEFKNLMSVTKLRNVSGVSGRTSQRATDLFMKCRYLDEITGGKGVVFATGTPISNSITELHTMMRYMQYDFLHEHGMQNFDNWVSVFGKQKTDYELAPTGDKFKTRTRIASYANMPELMAMFSMCADVKTSDMLDLPVPECEMHIVNAMPTQLQQELVQELSARADDVQTGAVDPREDNMLKITGDGRKVGLDPRLIDPEFEDDPNTKLNLCVKNVFDIYQSTAADKLTQIIFCDLGVPKPKSNANNGTEQPENDDDKSMAEIDSLEEINDFCVYDDIKEKLIDMGVNPSEVAFIHDAKSETQKAEMFEKVRSGEIRVLIGSTAKMGTGTNVQDRLVALHDLDVPWRPADLEQRRGRMVRQGNKNEKVHLYRYVTKGTFDAYSYQILETKQRFISQIMTSKSPARTCQDVDQEALEYGTIKALCTGDERIKEKLTLENRTKELELFKKEYTNTRYSLEDKLKSAPERRESICRRIEKMEHDFALFQKIPLDQDNMPVFEMKLDGVTYTDRKDAAAALKEICDKIPFSADRDKICPIGEIHGFNLSVMYDTEKQCMLGIVSGQETYTTTLSAMSLHSVKKLESLVNGIGDKLAAQRENLTKFDTDIQSAQEILAKPFEFEQELKDSIERLETLTDELNAEAARKLQSAKKTERTHYFGKEKIIKSGNKKSDLPNEQDKDQQKNKPNDKGEDL